MDYTRNPSAPLSIAGLSRALLSAIRPRQWTKNLTIYLAVFFTVNEAWNPTDFTSVAQVFISTTIAFVIFSVLSSSVYLINDVLDIGQDRKHPTKMHRPIAAGLIPVPLARYVAVILAVAGLGMAFWLEPWFGGIALGYVASMVAYSIALKRVVLLDVFIIGGGFILRVVAGAVVIDVPVSPWLYLCTGLAALFLALAKRRSELALAGGDAHEQRDTLQRYTLPMLDQLLTIAATSSVLAYSFYTFTASNLPENGVMMLTIPFVVYGLFRYLYLVHTKNMGENLEEMITDGPLLVTIALWLSAAILILGIFR